MKQRANVEIYTWDNCPYCKRAIELLEKKSIKYTRYRIDGDEEAKEKMIKRANGRDTVPQVFINDNHIGGCDDTYSLDEKGELDKLIFAGP